MIQSKSDLNRYLEITLKVYYKVPKYNLTGNIKQLIFPDYNYRYMVALRKYEYCCNCRGRGLLRWFYLRKIKKLEAKSGIELPPNVAESGLRVPHGKITVNANSQIGCDCKIMSDVTIGTIGRYDCKGAPKIGNRVFIGTGAKILGNIRIADDVVIGANAVVIQDVLETGITVAGIPAKKVSDTDSYHYLNKQ